LNVRHGKGDKQRVAALHPEAAPLLNAWLATRADLGDDDEPKLNGRQPVFCSVADGRTRKRGAPMDTGYVRRLLPKLAALAGIDKLDRQRVLQLGVGVRRSRSGRKRLRGSR
jgi:site-specific recombinase XerD